MSAQEILELQKKNCIFCKIIAKEIPSYEIYSDEKVSVILDINPAHEGHCLILPKNHYQILPQVPLDLIGYMFTIAKKTSRTLLKSLGIQGTTIFVANGALAGQKAPHFMIHVVPRQRGDQLFKIPKNSISAEELLSIKNKLVGEQIIQQEKQEIEPVKQEIKQEEVIEQKHVENKPQTVEERIVDPKEESKKEIQEDVVEKVEEELNSENKVKENNKQEQKKDTNIDDIANLFLN